MDTSAPEKKSSLQVIAGSITHSRKDLVGQHDWSRKPMVFRGQLNGATPVAIKTFIKAGVDEEFDCIMKSNFQVLSSDKNRHPNLIRYYGEAEDENFK